MKEIPRSEFTVGVEEELHLVDPDTHRLRPAAVDVLGALDLPDEMAGHEAYAEQIELRSTPCANAQEVRHELAGARRAAAAAGATLMGVGLHPTDTWGDTPLVDKPRYRELAHDMRDLFGRTPEAALHVHVGVPDVETGIHVFNRMRRHLPLLIALAANSPWWFNHDSGMASARWALVRSSPGRGVPPEFIDWAHYIEHIAKVGTAGGPPDYTLVWWDLRPHPRLGTLEIRELDAQSSLDAVEGIAALVQTLARREAEAPRSELPPAEAIAWSCFRAARDGLDAEILYEGEIVPARLALAGLGVPEVAPLLAEGGASRRRAAHARGGVEEMLRDLVAETAA